MLSVTESFELSADHTLARVNFTAEENLQTFGECSTLPTVDDETGMKLNMSKLEPIIKGEILDHVDLRDLGRDVPGLNGGVTTAKNTE